MIKKGFKNSIGWNLGKTPISIHLVDPFTSIPIKWTKINVVKKNTNRMNEILKSLSCSRREKKINNATAKHIKTVCLIKK